MVDEPKKVKLGDNRPAPPPSQYPKLIEPALDTSPPAHGELGGGSQKAQKVKRLKPGHGRSPWSNKFHTRIAKLTRTEYETWFSLEQHCADVIALYKIREGSFCSCKKDRDFKTIPPDKHVYTKNRPYHTYCAACGKASERNLYRDTPLHNCRIDLVTVFRGFYLWRRSKPLEKYVHKLPGNYVEKEADDIAFERKTGAVQLQKLLQISTAKATTCLRLYQNHYEDFWSKLIVPHSIHSQIIRLPSRWH